MDAKERQKLIKEASQAYYSDGTSSLTDAEFDALLEEERIENPDSELLKVGHGFDVNLVSGKKFPHKYGIVGSLDKCHNWKEFPKGLKDKKVCKSLKLDGISCVMYYNNGLMYQALTRGTNNIGIDITDKVQKISPDYFRLDTNFTGAVRGEILMPFSKYEKFSASHTESKNSRNATSGLMSMKDVSDDLKYLQIIVYTVIGVETKESYPFPLYPFTDYSSMHDWLVENFGPSNVVPFMTVTYESEDKFNSDMIRTRDVWYDDYPADGIVITNDDIRFNSTNSGTSIEYEACAFKFPAETKETVVEGIEWNLSKTKKLVPTILVAPVVLSGAEVRRAAGCSAKMVKDMQWGIGARVKMTRSGEVIPKIEATISPVVPEIPEVCPCCNATLVWDGVDIKCPNPDCKDMQIQDLLIWCNSLAPTDGLGDTLKLKFFQEWHDRFGMEMSIEGLYHFNHPAFASFGVNGVQQELFRQMVCRLVSGCTRCPEKFHIISALKALNIPRLGDATAELLSHYPDDINALMVQTVPNNLVYKIGTANTQSIVKHLNKFKRLNYIKRNLVFEDTSSNIEKIKVAITGSLSIPRSQFESLLRENGFICGDMTKDTKYLITNEPNPTSSKAVKAAKLGVTLISEADFRAKFNI